MAVKKYSLIVFVLSLWLAASTTILGQETGRRLIISWEAQTLRPLSYSGKNLAGLGSEVIAALELTENDKLADVLPANIRWFLNNRLIDSGVGLKRISFNAASAAGAMSLRAEVDYGGEVVGGAARIFVARPEIVIDAPYPNGVIGTGANKLEAVPYFFDITDLKDLKIEWLINNQAAPIPAENPHLLELSIEPFEEGEIPVSISVSASPLNNFFNFATDKINLTAKP